MTPEECYKKLLNKTQDHFVCFAKIMAFVVAIVVILLVTSCATKTRIEYRDRVVDNYNTVTVHDTLREKTSDSTFVFVATKGDTVYQNVYRERIRWRDRVVEHHDTCYRDSIVTEYKESVREVVKYPKNYWYAVGISILFIIFAIIFAIIKVYKWLR